MPKPWSSDSPLSAPTEDTLLLKEFRREQVGADGDGLLLCES